MTQLNFRPLKADEIDCRIGQVSRDGRSVSVLLYKDARVDMNILDETVGPASWQREHYECKGNLYCRVGILIDSAWVWKADCGTESNTEAIKGESSDSFKRACVNWGIGRALYSAPKIWLPYDKDTYQKMGVHVSKIVYTPDGKNIEGLVLSDGNNQELKRFGRVDVAPQTPAQPAPQPQAPAPAPAPAKKKIVKGNANWKNAIEYACGRLKDKNGKIVDGNLDVDARLVIIKERYDIDDATFADLEFSLDLNTK